MKSTGRHVQYKLMVGGWNVNVIKYFVQSLVNVFSRWRDSHTYTYPYTWLYALNSFGVKDTLSYVIGESLVYSNAKGQCWNDINSLSPGI